MNEGYNKKYEQINESFKKSGLNPKKLNKSYDKNHRFYNPLYDCSNNNSQIIIK